MKGLLAFAETDTDASGAGDAPLPVRTLIKGDMRCSSVAGAGVLAKVERDAAMVAYATAHPVYGWAVNKGYAAPEHRSALLEHGPCALHRRSWNLLAAPAQEAQPPGTTSAMPDEAPDVGVADMDEAAPAVSGPGSSRMGDDERRGGDPRMSSEDLEKYETEMELQLYREYRDVVGLYSRTSSRPSGASIWLQLGRCEGAR